MRRETRSQAKLRVLQESWHPQAVTSFKEGLGSVLRQWTALELAVHHQWGGFSSSEKAENLEKELLELFVSPDKVYKDDVALVLEDYLDVNFYTVCEDGSTEEVGDILCTMFRQCCEGDFTLVHNSLAREYVRHEHEVLQQSQGLCEDGDVDDNEDIDPNNIESLNSVIADRIQSIEEEVEEEIKIEPIEVENTTTTDVAIGMQNVEDGWETVQRGKNANSKKKSYRI
mmetsp:Transcript_20536/g.28303  ORF Transcript_20536/g.28303 Transcript_20536/m.28303 type:complete len:228 (+) Transcript_20536:49-732(+)